jgi:hypothetical protein
MEHENRFEKWTTNLRVVVGQDAQLLPDAEVERKHGVTARFVKYWGEKYRNPLFHPGELGGARHTIFDDAAQLYAEGVLYMLLVIDSRRTNTELARALREVGLPVDRKQAARATKTYRSCCSDGLLAYSSGGSTTTRTSSTSPS